MTDEARDALVEECVSQVTEKCKIQLWNSARNRYLAQKDPGGSRTGPSGLCCRQVKRRFCPGGL